jgi:hypothetical protein
VNALLLAPAPSTAGALGVSFIILSVATVAILLIGGLYIADLHQVITSLRSDKTGLLQTVAELRAERDAARGELAEAADSARAEVVSLLHERMGDHP